MTEITVQQDIARKYWKRRALHWVIELNLEAGAPFTNMI